MSSDPWSSGKGAPADEGVAGNANRRFVSAHDVALRAGVSRSAVSRAFTPGASIAPATLAKVQEAADALGYQVNDLARGLLANRSRIVGLVTSDAGAPFRAEMIAALSRALIERGNVPAIINIGPTSDDIANASRQLLRYRAEATVFLSGSPRRAWSTTRQNGQPLILINRAETELDSVRCDDRGAPGKHSGSPRGRRLQLRRDQRSPSEPEPAGPRTGLPAPRRQERRRSHRGARRPFRL